MFNIRLLALMAESKTNKQQLCKQLDITDGAINGWLKGSQPSADKIVRIADYFEVTTDYLLGRSNDIGIVQSNANLTDTENKVLSALRQLPVKDQQRILDVIRALTV